MNCSQCGAVVVEGLKFCSKCGARVKVIEDKSHSEEQEHLKQEELKQEDLRECRAQHLLQEKKLDQGIQLLIKPTIQSRQESKILKGQEGHTLKGPKDKMTEGAEHKVEEGPESKVNEAGTESAATVSLQSSQAQALLDQIQKATIGLEDKQQNKNKAKAFAGQKKEKAAMHDLQKTTENKKGSMQTNELKLFFKFMKDFMKNPLMEKAEVDERLDTKNTFIYIGILLALNTLTSVILMEFMLRGLKDLIDVVAYLMSNLNADTHYLTGKIGVAFIAGSLVMNMGHIIVFALLMGFVGSKILKRNINWQEVCKYMLVPLSVLTIGKLPVIFMTILSVKLGLILYVLLVGLMMMVGMAALGNRYGRRGAGIYSISGLYLLSMSMNAFVGIKIMMIF